MKYSYAPLVLALGASAVSIKRDSCIFTLTSSGGESGTVGQLSDGQNRVGGGLPTGYYTFSNGQITDSEGRGCILTPPTTQFQCDSSAIPTSGFSISSSGQVEYNGSTTFYACPASETEYNIYTVPVSGQTKCVEIELTASGCYASSTTAPPATTEPATTAAPVTTAAPEIETVYETTLQTIYSCGPTVSNCPEASTTTPVVVASTSAPPASTSSSCPASLSSGNYQYPHLIVPVSSAYPGEAIGTEYDATINNTVKTIYNFDIPTSYSGHPCSLVFLFPTEFELETSSYTFSGNGVFDFTEISPVASSSTTYNTQGAIIKDFGEVTVTPGSSIVVATFDCPAGETVAYEISSVSGTSLEYFQDYNPSPIGLYVVEC